MEKIVQKYATLTSALVQLKNALDLYKKIESNRDIAQLRGGDEDEVVFQLEPLLFAARESVIQRFEYCIDLLWKYMRLFLEKEGLELDELKSPKNIFRKAVNISGITEAESKIFIKMLDARNLSSHIYREEIAEQLIAAIPEYYQLMQSLVSRITPA